MGLALDVGLAGFSLGIERVELEVEVMLGRLAGVDRAAKDLSFGWLHRCTFLPPRSKAGALAAACSPSISSRRLTAGRSQKKRSPFQAVPVMARGMAERLGHVYSPHTVPPGTTV